jgi:CRP-like cAMP-binding protein
MIDADKLGEIYLFSQLSDETLSRVAGALEARAFAADEVLFHRGEPGRELFVVREGSIGIFEPDPEKAGQEKPIRIFGPDEVLGEMAIIDSQPRTLSARAMEPTQTLVLDQAHFQELLHDHAMALAVMASLNDRIRYTTEFLSEVQGWVGRVANGQYEFVNEVRGWVKKLAEGDFDAAAQTGARHRDPTIATLAAEFAQMAAQVKKREENLRAEIAKLKIEIDEKKRERTVSEITDSDFFQDIQARARNLRRKRRSE